MSSLRIGSVEFIKYRRYFFFVVKKSTNGGRYFLSLLAAFIAVSDFEYGVLPCVVCT